MDIFSKLLDISFICDNMVFVFENPLLIFRILRSEAMFVGESSLTMSYNNDSSMSRKGPGEIREKTRSSETLRGRTERI